MNRKFLFSACLSAGLALSACGGVGDTGTADNESLRTAGMALNVDLLGGTDVVGFRFTATQVDCTTGAPLGLDPYSADESLKNLMLPGGNSTFENKPYDEDSSHHFADHFFSVEPGCYDIAATPIDDGGAASADCATATLYKELVKDDEFNEIHLISQCRGLARTALDIIGSLNHPPEMTLEVDKFMCAGAGVVACATATDPDGDPLRFYWEGEDSACFSPYVISSEYDDESGEWTECVVLPSYEAGSLPYSVTVKDLGWDGGSKVPIETLLPEQRDALGVVLPPESRETIYFETHALDDCIPGGMAFIGVTMGANLCEVDGKLETDDSWGMKEAQAGQVAENAINYVNPNLLGDSDPRILVVLDNGNPEDDADGEYIQQLLQTRPTPFTQVDYMVEPLGGLQWYHTISYSIVWFVNPGYPIDDDTTYLTLLNFRTNGGGVIISGDDANQNNGLIPPKSMSNFSFMSFDTTATNDNPNGTWSCGYQTDGNTGKKYIVRLSAGSPLAAGLNTVPKRTFRYGNDIDRNIALGAGETVNATTRGINVSGKHTCLGDPVPVMTTVPAGTILP